MYYVRRNTAFYEIYILWHVDPLLGNDRETHN
jgi:hypothetical protein